MEDILLKKELIAPIIIILVSIIIYVIIKNIINRFYKMRMTRKNEKKRKTVKSIFLNVIKYFIFIIDLNMILEVIGIDTKSILASIGVVSLIAGLALQDLLKDFIVGVSILLEDQYSVGDIVEIGNFKGTIVDFGLRTTKIKAYTGEVKIIANRNIIELVNYSINDGMALVDVMISYEDDLLKAKKVLNNLCEDFSKKEECVAEVLGVDSLDNNGVVIKISIKSSYDRKIALSRQFKEEVKLLLDKHKITIPYPQMVVHDGKRI